jgi:23S rRNA pseudouridine1911/1915/1917 synthase
VASRAWVVTPAAAGVRLDVLLAGADLGLSRSRARQLVDGGHVTVGGRRRKAGYLVRAGEQVAVDIVAAPAYEAAAPEALPLEVLYEDAVLIAINKAPGMVVHPAPGRWTGTLVNALLHRWGPLPARDRTRPGLIHRLDRDTSGVIVVARTGAALEHVARQFHERTVDKRYLAIVRGVPRRDELVVDAAVGRHPTDRKRMSTRARVGRRAVTRVRVLERFRSTALVEARPETGRTHQIRVHLAAAGHPIVGDQVYGRVRAHALLARQALHAAVLTITHPVRGERLTIRAPLWPDVAALLEQLRAECATGASK